jgi:hypothetical protein
VTKPRPKFNSFRLPTHAITLERWRELMKGRQRNLTDDPIRVRKVEDGGGHGAESLLDTYIAKEAQ